MKKNLNIIVLAIMACRFQIFAEEMVHNLLLDQLKVPTVSEAKNLGFEKSALGQGVKSEMGDAFFEGYEVAEKWARIAVRSEDDRLPLFPTYNAQMLEKIVGECAALAAYSSYYADEDIRSLAWLTGFVNYQHSLNDKLSSLRLKLKEQELKKVPSINLRSGGKRNVRNNLYDYHSYVPSGRCILFGGLLLGIGLAVAYYSDYTRVIR
ncbi:MAG: hypothetical protein LBF65_03535 [Holosporales bacterium]|nr:hypothetical protein [Holosporales bacterium]